MGTMNQKPSYVILATLALTLSFFLFGASTEVATAQGAGSPPTEMCPQQKTGSGAKKSSLNVGAGSNNETCKPKDDEGFYEGKPYQWKCIEGTKVMKNILGKPCDVKDPKSGVTTPGKCDYAEACKASNPTGQAQPGGMPPPPSGSEKKGGEEKQGEGGMPKMPEIPSGGGGSGSGSGGGGQPQQQGGEQQTQKDDSARTTDTAKNADALEQPKLGPDGKPLVDVNKSADQSVKDRSQLSDREDWFGASLNPFASNIQNTGVDAGDPFSDATGHTNSARLNTQTGIDPEAPFSDAASQLLNSHEEQVGSIGQRVDSATLPQGLEVGYIESPADVNRESAQDFELKPSEQNNSRDVIVNDAGFRASASFQESFDSGYTPPQSMIQRAYNSIKNSVSSLFRF